MLKLTQEQFDSTIRRTIEERDATRASDWKTLAAESKPLQMFAFTALEKIDSAVSNEEALRFSIGMTTAAIQLGYELAKTEIANERAELTERSNQLT